MSLRRLDEQINKFHKLTNTTPTKNNQLSEQVIDNKKADTVKDDVGEFYSNLENAMKGGGVSQEERGSMNFKKEVESIQIGLELLGYQLPRHGVDGFFGPETAEVITKYMSDNKLLNESASQLRQNLKNLGYTEKGSEISNGGEITGEVGKAVTEILTRFKKLRPDVQIKVTGGNDSFHQKNSPSSMHTTGNAIDMVLSPSDSKTLDQFISVINEVQKTDSKIGFIDEYRNPSSKATAPHMHIFYGNNKSAKGGPSTVTKTFVVATPDMIRNMLGKLKMKGIKDGDIKKYTNINTSTISEKGKELINNPDFMVKIRDIANTIKVGESSILKMMSHESHVDPTVVNSIGCVGLIQFCPDNKGSNIKTIGTRKYDLSELRTDLTKQLEAIKEFWRIGYNNNRINEPTDLFIYNFFPIAAGKPDDFVLQTQKLSAEKIATQNPVFNRVLGRPSSTPLTVGDLKRYYRLSNMI